MERNNIERSNKLERKLPNILFIMADDLGWGNVGWPGHNTQNDEINTPNIDDLVANGLQLDRHYVYEGCAPTRASFQTGRLPIHCTTKNAFAIDDPTQGIPTGMTSIASKLKQAGYKTHLVGKWDGGFATYDKLPVNRGYDTFYGFLGKTVGYFSKFGECCTGTDYIDLWENNAPAYISMDEVNNNTYLEFTFMERVINLLDNYSNSNNPFYLMYSMHLPHAPINVPQQYLESLPNDENTCQNSNDYIYPGFSNGSEFECRSTVQSQVNLMDAIIGEIIDRLKENDLYNNTLIVFSSDNGGSLDLNETAHNNYPLRGGKKSLLEGGIRATSFVSGGFLPKRRRGQIEYGLMAIADWFVTFCEIAGIDWNDYDAMEAGLPNVDGINMWPMISGEVPNSPRSELPISENVLIQGKYKYLKANQRYAIWQGITFPNTSSADTYEKNNFEDIFLDCAMKGCLFDVVNDPFEYNDLADSMANIALVMNERLKELSSTIFEDEQTGIDSCPSSYVSSGLSCGCWMAINNYNYFAGPYQDLTKDEIHFIDNVIDTELLIINKFDNQTNKRIKQHNYSIYFGLLVIIFIGIFILIKYYKTSKHKSRQNGLLNYVEIQSYGTA